MLKIIKPFGVASMRYKTELLIFLPLLLTSAWFFQGGAPNGNTRLDLALSLIFDGDFSIQSFHKNTIDKILLDGKFYSEKAPGVSWLLVILLMPFSLFLSKADILSSDILGNLLLYISTVGVSGLSSSFAAVYLYKIFRILGMEEKQSSLVSLGAYLGTMALPYSTALFSHQLSANMIVFILYFLIQIKRGKESYVWKFVLLNSFLPFFELTLVLISLIFFTYFVILRKEHLLSYGQYIPLLLLAPFCLLLHNYCSYGNPFILGYGKLSTTPFSSGMSQGVFGLTLPKVEVMVLLLFSFYRGFFVFNPFCLVGLTKIKESFSLHGRLFSWTLLTVCLTLVMINSSYFYWQGGNCFGPRHLVPMIPVWVILFSPGFFSGKIFVKVLFLISYAVSMVGTAIDVYMPERILNPIVFAVVNFMAGNMALNRNNFLTNFYDGNYFFQGRVGEMGADNWGLAMGLEGFWSVTPLLLLHFFAYVMILLKK